MAWTDERGSMLSVSEGVTAATSDFAASQRERSKGETGLLSLPAKEERGKTRRAKANLHVKQEQ